jgi:hypothetical protein
VARLPDLAICHLVPDGEAWLPVKTEPDFGHGQWWRCLRVATLLKASSLQLSSRLGYSGGNPRSGSPRSDDGDARCRFPPSGHRFRSIQWLEVALRWSGVSLPASTAVVLGGVVPWSLDGGCVLRCAHRVGAPSSAMVTLMVGSVRGFASVYHSGDGLAGSGRGDFQRMRTIRYLLIVLGRVGVCGDRGTRPRV